MLPGNAAPRSRPRNGLVTMLVTTLVTTQRGYSRMRLNSALIGLASATLMAASAAQAEKWDMPMAYSRIKFSLRYRS